MHLSARRGKISLRDYVIINWPCECARFGIATVLACVFCTAAVLKGGLTLQGKPIGLYFCMTNCILLTFRSFPYFTLEMLN